MAGKEGFVVRFYIVCIGGWLQDLLCISACNVMELGNGVDVCGLVPRVELEIGEVCRGGGARGLGEVVMLVVPMADGFKGNGGMVGGARLR